MEKVTADVIETARELELEVGHRLLQSQDLAFTGEKVPLRDEQTKWFLETTRDKDC